MKSALITVHKITIGLSIAGGAVFTLWSFLQGGDRKAWIAGGLSALVTIGLVIYLIAFIKRTRA